MSCCARFCDDWAGAKGPRSKGPRARPWEMHHIAPAATLQRGKPVVSPSVVCTGKNTHAPLHRSSWYHSEHVNRGAALNGVRVASSMIMCYGQNGWIWRLHSLYQDLLEIGCHHPKGSLSYQPASQLRPPYVSQSGQPKPSDHVRPFILSCPIIVGYLSPLLVPLSWLGCVAIEWFYHHDSCPNRNDSVWFCEI